MTASVFESATATVLNDAQRNELETLERAGTTTQKLAARCRVMLLAEQGLPNRAIARQVGSAADGAGSAECFRARRRGGLAP